MAYITRSRLGSESFRSTRKELTRGKVETAIIFAPTQEVELSIVDYDVEENRIVHRLKLSFDEWREIKSRIDESMSAERKVYDI